MDGAQFKTQLVHYVVMHRCINVGKELDSIFQCAVHIIADVQYLLCQSPMILIRACRGIHILL